MKRQLLKHAIEQPPSLRGAAICVAIACYNQARFLERCIQSVLDQSHAAQDIIVVDDGSSDETREVVMAFEDVRYVFQVNSGLSSARNAALELSTERRILFLDADDWLAPIALEAATEAFESSAVAPAFVYGGYNEVSEDERILSTHFARGGPDAFLQLLRGNFVAMHGTVLYDADVLRASGGFDTTLASCEDYDVLLRLARNHPIVAYPQVAASYRRHGESLSSDRIAMIDSALRVIRRHFESTPKTQPYVDAAREGRRYMTSYYVRQMKKDLRVARAHGRLCRAIGALLVSASRRPRVVGQILRSSVLRTERAPRMTG